MQRFKMLFWMILLLINKVQPEPTLTGCQYTPWYSEEQGNATHKLPGYPMTGLKCRGEHCDDLSAQQCTHLFDGFQADLKAPSCDEPLLPFSEEGSAMQKCPDGKFVESMRCAGGYCDNIILTCCGPRGWRVDASRTQSTPWLTDNGGGESCPAMHVVVGARCRGGYCGEMQLLCAPIGGRAGSASGTWSAVCSTNVPGSLCHFTQNESVKRDRQATWDARFSAEVYTSLSSGITFRGINVSLHDTVMQRVSQLVDERRDTSRPCSVSSKGTRNGTVWWQWVMDIEDLSIININSSPQMLRVTTCFFLQTSELNYAPQCTPGYCMGYDCQLCTPEMLSSLLDVRAQRWNGR